MIKQLSKLVLRMMSSDKLNKLQKSLIYLNRGIEAVVDEKKVNSYSSILALKWKVTGVPSEHDFKARLINDINRNYNFGILIETGSFKGEMIRKQLEFFSKIYSIELLPEFYLELKEQFKGVSNVELVQGSSGDILPSLLKKVNEPCVFWLDAHYQVGNSMGKDIDAPVKAEIEAILKRPFRDVVLIDDSRFFNGSLNYPTIDEIEQKFKSKDPSYNVVVKEDVIIIQ